jgi:hypothetical protein
VIGAAQFLGKHFDEAVPDFLLSMQEDASYPDLYRLLAACYAHMGRVDDEREIVMRLRAIRPSRCHGRSPARSARRELSGLRLAAGKEK